MVVSMGSEYLSSLVIAFRCRKSPQPQAQFDSHSLCDLCVHWTSASASWVDGLWLTSDEARTECFKTWSSYDNGRQLVPGYYCAW